MAKVIKVNSVRLGSDAQKIQEDLNRINKRIDVLESKIIELDAMWDGESSEAFKQIFHTDLEELKSEFQSLNKLAMLQNVAKKNYETADRNVSDIISKIKI